MLKYDSNLFQLKYVDGHAPYYPVSPTFRYSTFASPPIFITPLLFGTSEYIDILNTIMVGWYSRLGRPPIPVL